MENYCGNNKPYIYVAFPKEKSEESESILEALAKEGILFWCGNISDKKELQRIEGAHAVLLFVSKEHLRSDEIKTVVDCAVRHNKNILTLYMDDCSPDDEWAHMQLDSAQALWYSAFSSCEDFILKVKEAEIFRDMAITPSQIRFQRRRSLTIIGVTILSIIIVFFAVVYPLLIVPAMNKTDDPDRFGVEGLTQEELDKVHDLYLLADIPLDKDVGFTQAEYNPGTKCMELQIVHKDGSWEYIDSEKKGDISDISDISKMRNLEQVCLVAQNIRDISPLCDLNKIGALVLDCNPISSLEGISKLENLNYLRITGTNISDLSPLINNKELNNIAAGDCPIDKIPEELALRVNHWNLIGTSVTEMPYVGEQEFYNLEINNTPLKQDYSFLRDVKSFDCLQLDCPDLEKLLAVIKGKKVERFNVTNSGLKTIDELFVIDIVTDLNVCWTDTLTSIEGIEHFDSLKYVSLKGCTNVHDFTPLLKLKHLEKLELYPDQREQAEKQLKGASFIIEYHDW